MSTIESYYFQMLLPELLKIKGKFTTEIKELIERPSSHTPDNLKEALLRTKDQLNSYLTYYLYISYILALENEEAISINHYKDYIQAIKEISKIEDLDNHLLTIRIGNSSISRATNPPITLENLIFEFKFLTILKKSKLNLNQYLDCIESQAKLRIYSSISSVNDIESALINFEKINECKMNLFYAKKNFLLIVENFDPPISQARLENIKNRLNPNLSSNNEISSENIKIEERYENKSNIYSNTNINPEIDVFKCNVSGENRIIAVKKISSAQREKLEPFKNEGKLLEKLKNGIYFAKYYNMFYRDEKRDGIDRHVLYIEMEYIDYTLAKFREENVDRQRILTENEIRHIFKQLVNGFQILYQENINHSDIKPSNLMITKDLQVKIIDFNISKEIKQSNCETTAKGTEQFMSPEMRKSIIDGKKFRGNQEKSDVFSLGLSILSLVTQEGLVDVNLESNKAYLKEIINSIRYPWLKQFLSKMLEFNPNNRISIREINKEFDSDFTKPN